jgi:hypothetical protein
MTCIVLLRPAAYLNVYEIRNVLMHVKPCLVFPCNVLLDPDDLSKITETTRKLGLVVVRGTQVSLVSPQDGMEEIANPFIAADQD